MFYVLCDHVTIACNSIYMIYDRYMIVMYDVILNTNSKFEK